MVPLLPTRTTKLLLFSAKSMPFTLLWMGLVYSPLLEYTSTFVLRMPPRSPIAPKNAPLTAGTRNSGTVSSSPLSLKVQVTPWPDEPVADRMFVLDQMPAPVPYMAWLELNGSRATASTQLVALVPICGPRENQYCAPLAS